MQRIAIIGNTTRGRYGHHLDMAFVDVEGAEIVGLADPDDEGRAAAMSKTGAPEGFADSKADETLNTLVEGTSPHAQLDAVHQVAATGEVSEDLINQVASDMGVEASVLQGQLGGVIDAFEVQAREAITKVAGVDSEVVLEWVRSHRADQLTRAATSIVLNIAEGAGNTQRETSAGTISRPQALPPSAPLSVTPASDSNSFLRLVTGTLKRS